MSQIRRFAWKIALIKPTRYRTVITAHRRWLSKKLDDEQTVSSQTTTDNYDEIKRDFEAINNKYSILNTQHNTLNMNFDQLKSNYDTLNNEYDGLKTRNEKLSLRFATLETEHNELKGTNKKNLRTGYINMIAALVVLVWSGLITRSIFKKKEGWKNKYEQLKDTNNVLNEQHLLLKGELAAAAAMAIEKEKNAEIEKMQTGINDKTQMNQMETIGTDETDYQSLSFVVMSVVSAMIGGGAVYYLK